MVGAKIQIGVDNGETFVIPDAVIIAALFTTAFINGITVGILWAAANQYIAVAASDSNKGFFFSYFWAFYMSSQVFGNLIAAFSLGSLPTIDLFVIMAGITLVATISFAFVRVPEYVPHLRSMDGNNAGGASPKTQYKKNLEAIEEH